MWVLVVATKNVRKRRSNQQREVPEVLDAIKKTAVVKSSMHCTYLCVGLSQRCNFCPYYWKICDNIKQKTLYSCGVSVVRVTSVL